MFPGLERPEYASSSMAHYLTLLMDDFSEIKALEALSRDYSETPREVLFVLGSGEGAAAEVFEAAANQRHTTIDPLHLKEMAAGSRRSLLLSTPMQMVPEIVRSLARVNVAVYQVRLLGG
jgi:hypothetical protein